MKKKYITPESIVVEIDVTSIFAASPNSVEAVETKTSGQGVAEGTEYRSTLWN